MGLLQSFLVEGMSHRPWLGTDADLQAAEMVTKRTSGFVVIICCSKGRFGPRREGGPVVHDFDVRVLARTGSDGSPGFAARQS